MVAAPIRASVLALAVKANVHPKSARKWLRGEHVRGDAGARIALAAAELGIQREPADSAHAEVSSS